MATLFYLEDYRQDYLGKLSEKPQFAVISIAVCNLRSQSVSLYALNMNAKLFGGPMIDVVFR